MYTLKKSLGQHFLIDESVSVRISKALQEDNLERLLEVGPGGGALTKYLIAIPNIEFKAVEVDDEKVLWLKKTFPELSDKIIHQSILDIEKPFAENFTVVGNFPYNISTQIVFRVLEWKESVDIMIGMFQKEVADRIIASEGSKVYGVTSVLTQAFYTVDHLFDVGAEAFNPPPRVNSSVIRLRKRPVIAAMKSERAFFVLVKTAFNQRRKTLRNAVKSLFDPDTLQDPIFNKRAEQISVEDFSALSFRMK